MKLWMHTYCRLCTHACMHVRDPLSRCPCKRSAAAGLPLCLRSPQAQVPHAELPSCHVCGAAHRRLLRRGAGPPLLLALLVGIPSGRARHPVLCAVSAAVEEWVRSHRAELVRRGKGAS